MGRRFRELLPEELYRRLERTYPDCGHMWDAAFGMLDLFGIAARSVAGRLGFAYDEGEEQGIRDYMEKVREESYE